MNSTAVRAYAAILAIGIAAGCTGQIGELPSGTAGSGSGSGTVPDPAPPATAERRAAQAPSERAGGGADPTGTAGTTGAPPTQIDLSGSPKYYRFVRLTNAQWARAVQDVLKLPAPRGWSRTSRAAVSGTTDFTNNELVLDVDQRGWADFQAAAETLAAQVTAIRRGARRASTPAPTPRASSRRVGRRAYRRPLTAAETAAYMTLFDTGATLSGTQQRVRQGRGAGHPRDAAVAALPLPHRARRRRARRSPATRWRPSCRSGCAAPRPTTRCSTRRRARQARHRRRRRGAGDDDAGRARRRRR